MVEVVWLFWGIFLYIFCFGLYSENFYYSFFKLSDYTGSKIDLLAL